MTMTSRYLWIKIAGAYIGAVIGAGFASGQENLQFFGIHGSEGLVGAVLAGLLFVVLGIFFLATVSSLRTCCYYDLLRVLLGKRLAGIFDALLAVFLFFGLVVMLAGSGAVVEEYLGVAVWFGRIGSAVIIFVAIIIGANAVFWVNLLCVPALVIGGIWVSISQLISPVAVGVLQDISREISFVPGNWVGSAVIYVAYNMLLALSLFGAIGNDIEDKATVLLGGAAGGGVLGGLLVLFQVVVRQVEAQIGIAQIPMLWIASRLGRGFYVFYAMCLWMAMLTTGVANAYSLLKRVVSTKNSSFLYSSLGIIGAALPLTCFGFVNLIKTVYPLFGYVGLILIILVIAGVIGRRACGFYVKRS